jgi:hypothetical protein
MCADQKRGWWTMAQHPYWGPGHCPNNSVEFQFVGLKQAGIRSRCLFRGHYSISAQPTQGVRIGGQSGHIQLSKGRWSQGAEESR